MDIQVLVDNSNSWIISYARSLHEKLQALGHASFFITDHKNISSGDILFLLGCEKIIKPETLKLHRFNIVIHESKLPQGKGWSPMSWQILEGKKKIPFTLFEAAANVDSGQIYLEDSIETDGHELIDELRSKQGNKTIEMALEFVKKIHELKPTPQSGDSSYYPKRTPKDSELDVEKSIRDQFNLLRICDNERYPAFFNLNGKKYILKIEKSNNDMEST